MHKARLIGVARWIAVGSALVAGVALFEGDAAADLNNTSVTIGTDAGTILLQATTQASTSLLVQGTTTVAHGATTCARTAAISLPAQTLDYGNVAAICPTTCGNFDCYTQGTNARYVARLNATLSATVGTVAGVQVYLGTSTMLRAPMFYGNGIAPDWTLATPGGGAVTVPATADATAIVKTQDSNNLGTPMPHEFMVEVQSADTSATRTAQIIYHVY